ESGKELGPLEKRKVASLSFSPDGAQALIGEELGGLALWDLQSGHRTLKLEGHTDAVTCVAFAANGATLISGGADGSIRQSDPHTGQELARFQGHTQKVTSVVFSAQDRHVLSGSTDGAVHWWQVPDMARVDP